MSVARLCLGTAKLGMPWYGVGSVSRPGPAEIVEILRKAVALGINWIDTAAAYGDAEDWVRETILGQDVHVVNKTRPELIGAMMRGRYWRNGGVLLHNPTEAQLAGGAVSALHDMVTPAAWAGASVYTPEQARAAVEAHADAIQVPFCILDHRHEVVIRDAKRRGVVVFARQPFLQGILTNRAGYRWPEILSPEVQAFLTRLGALCASYGVTRLRVALWYALDSGADFVVFGAGSVSHLEEVVEAAQEPPAGWISLRQELSALIRGLAPVEFGSMWKTEGGPR